MKTSCPINNRGAIKVTCPLLSFRGSHLSLACLILMEDCDGLAFGRLAPLSSSDCAARTDSQSSGQAAALLLLYDIFQKKGIFEAHAVGVILQRRRVQSFPEKKSGREDIWLSN